jgi:hypothetical protein
MVARIGERLFDLLDDLGVPADQWGYPYQDR